METNVDELEERISLARRLLRQDDPLAVFAESSDKIGANTALLFGYIRSFVRLASLRDVSLVACELDTTRQTVGRHINELENLLGERLFFRVGQESPLTDAGALWLSRSEEIFELASAFLSRNSRDPSLYRCTPLPLRVLLRGDDAAPELQDFLREWMSGERYIDSKGMARFRDKWIVYGREGGEWKSLEIGQNATYRQWFGDKPTNDSIGKTVAEMAGGADLHDELSLHLDGVYTRGGIHFSEVSCFLRKYRSKTRESLFYQRVLAEMQLSDDVPVVVSLISFHDQHP